MRTAARLRPLKKRPTNKKPRRPDLEAVFAAAGGLSPLADALGITRPAVTHWKRVPQDRIRDVARLTGLPLHIIRPDLYDALEA